MLTPRSVPATGHAHRFLSRFSELVVEFADAEQDQVPELVRLLPEGEKGCATHDDVHKKPVRFPQKFLGAASARRASGIALRDSEPSLLYIQFSIARHLLGVALALPSRGILITGHTP